MRKKYDVTKLSHIKVLDQSRTTIAYLEPIYNQEYLDLNDHVMRNNGIGKRYNVSEVEYIESFYDIISRNGLSVLLLDQSGSLMRDIDSIKITEIFCLARIAAGLNEDVANNIMKISLAVSKICADKLNVEIDVKNKFIQLLSRFIRIDLITKGIKGEKSYLGKNDQNIDYKVAIASNFLEIPVDRSVKDFSLAYDLNSIELNGKNIINFNEKEHVAKI